MASGAAHNCVLTAQNNLKCWGANTFGQLGNRTASMPVDSAVDVVGLTGIKGVALGRGKNPQKAGAAHARRTTGRARSELLA